MHVSAMRAGLDTGWSRKVIGKNTDVAMIDEAGSAASRGRLATRDVKSAMSVPVGGNGENE